jgi:hypothetical protein
VQRTGGELVLDSLKAAVGPMAIPFTGTARLVPGR